VLNIPGFLERVNRNSVKCGGCPVNGRIKQMKVRPPFHKYIKFEIFTRQFKSYDQNDSGNPSSLKVKF